jgi:hypothetical protein
MVQIPATNVVVYTRGTSDDGVGLGGYDVVAVAMIDPVDGTLSAGVTAEFSDGFTGACQLTSSSATRFLCYDGTAIRSYATTPGAATLSFDATLALSTEAAGDGRVQSRRALLRQHVRVRRRLLLLRRPSR